MSLPSSTFLGIYTASYDYTPQSDAELPLQEGDLLYVLEKSTDDDWWKAKKRTVSSDEDEPEGLVPSNYIEEATPIAKYRAIYDYTRQTQEEISFTEDAILDVYDISDPDWTLVGYNGEYGFAPANYIEADKDSGAPAAAAAAATTIIAAPPLPPRSPSPPSSVHEMSAEISVVPPPNLSKPLPVPSVDDYDDVPPPMPPRPTSNDYGSPRLQAQPRQPSESQHSPSSLYSNTQRSPSNRSNSNRKSARFAGHYSDSDSDDGPTLPVRRPPNERRAMRQQQGGDYDDRLHPISPGSPTNIPAGFRSFPVQELIGKKKHAAILALGPGRIILIPDKSTNPRGEWSVENMMNYSIEGKHVFIDVNYPTKSMDLHAGSKEAAEEIFQALGEINGAARAAGLREVMSAAESKYKRSDTIGTILWDFVATGQDEVSVAAGDEVTILDDRDGDFWLVKRTVNGAEGVVPSSFVERGRIDIGPSIEGRGKEQSRSATDKIRNSHLESNHHRAGSSASLPSGVQLPVRTTSLATKKDNSTTSKPDGSKLRTWTDRSGTFKVEAQFLGCSGGKIHLHKSNGVKIAVPVVKMSVEDLEYVESRTGMSLDEDKPLSALRGQQSQQPQSSKKQSGISIDRSSNNKTSPKEKEYDWFDFFLQCGIDLNNCQRYTLSFQRESMDESFLPDITPELMRKLGMKEGDILRVSKVLDSKYNRNNGGSDAGKKAVSFGTTEVITDKSESGGLFSGPGGALKNNTARKGRPAPTTVTSDVVDPKAFEQKVVSPVTSIPEPVSKDPPASNAGSSAKGGFEDDAWAPKPSKKPPSPQPQKPTVSTPAPVPVVSQPPPQAPPTSGALQDLSQLSLNTPPLEPVKALPPSQPQPQTQPQPQQIHPTIPQPSPQQQLPQIAAQPTGQLSGQQFPMYNPSMSSPLNPQYTAQPQQFTLQQQRQRPMVPPMSAAGLIPPPPQRPISAPQTYQPNNMGMTQPLTSQLTGLPPQGPSPSMLTSLAKPGQLSMADQLRMQQQQHILQQQLTGFPGMGNGLIPQSTGFPNQSGFQSHQSPTFMSGLPTIQQPQPQQPSAGFQNLLAQRTGMGFPQNNMSFQTSQQPVSIPVNTILPPPLIPQNTAQPPTLGFLGTTNPALTPLKPQPTGPAPNVRFGVQPGAKKIAPQPTGKKANLAAATPDNPFGF